MKKAIRLLIVEDSEPDAELAIREIRRGGYEPHWRRVQSAEEMESALAEEPWDAILADYAMPNFSAPAALAVLSRQGVDLPFILVSGSIGEEAAIDLVRHGANNFVLKDRLVRLVPTIERELRDQELRRERAHVVERLRLQLDRMAALRTIDQAIGGTLDLRVTLKIVLEQVVAQLHINSASVLKLNHYTQRLEYAAGVGFYSDAIQQTSLRIGEGLAGRAALDRTMIRCDDLPATGGAFARTRLATVESFAAYYAMPLIAKGQVKGVLEIFHRERLDPDPDWFGFLDALAGQTAIAIENAALFDELQKTNTELILAYDTTLEGWAQSLDLRNHESAGHTHRVTETTVRLGRSMGIHGLDLANLRRGAILHDIGLLGVPESVVLKPAPLTEDEWKLIRSHADRAYQILSPIAFLRPALDIPYCHHEQWNGSGYPRGLKGEIIPVGARLFAVADAWDAMRSERPYRPAMPEDRALEEIRDKAGSQFDPNVVEMFLQMRNNGMLDF